MYHKESGPEHELRGKYKLNRRKEIARAYKERKLRGGVYIITNTQNGKYLIGHTANLKSVQSHFQFALTTGSTIHPKLQKDWEKLGAQTFTLKVLEELEQEPEQSQVEFMDDLKTLEQLWRTNLDASKEY